MADDTSIVVDLTEPADPTAAAAPAESDVVVIPAEVPDDERLPARAVLQPDGSVILTLRYPVTLRFSQAGSTAPPREEHYAELRMYRLSGGAMRAVMSAGQNHTVTTGIAKSCRMAQFKFDALFDRMDGADVAAAAQVFSFFLYGGAPTATGQPSSP